MFPRSSSPSCATMQSMRSLSPSTSSFGRDILNNLKRSKLYHSLSSLDKTKLWSRFYVDDEDNIQRVLDVVSDDQKIITNPRLNRKRRTVMVRRNPDQLFGFTIQCYVIKRNIDDVTEKISYIDYVQMDSPAFEAGIRPGDVIISINGCVVTTMSHKDLIDLINSLYEMRMVLINDSIKERINLIGRAIKLRKLLNDKLYQLNIIDIQEQNILFRAYQRSLSAQISSDSISNKKQLIENVTNDSVFNNKTNAATNIIIDTKQNIEIEADIENDTANDIDECSCECGDNNNSYNNKTIINISDESIEPTTILVNRQNSEEANDSNNNNNSLNSSLSSCSTNKSTDIIDSIAFKHIFQLDDFDVLSDDNKSIHITKL